MALPRVFISTDLRLSSEEKDDAQSLIHALLYQDKMNIVGIAGTASKYGHQNGLVGDIDKIIDVYGKDHAKLEAHNTAYKSADELKAISHQGATAVAGFKGWSTPTDSSRAIIAEAKKAAAAGEKLNVLTWGGETDLAQALHDDPSIAQHVRFFNIYHQDDYAHLYITNNFKGKLDMWVDDQSTFRGMYQTPTSAGIIKGWHETNAKGHGALGDFFSELSGDIFNVSGVKMGDSPTVLRFLSGDQNDPTKESWGGEFVKTSDRYWTDNPDDALDFNRSNTDGAATVYEDRAAWLNSFAGRFDLLNGTTPTPTADDIITVRARGDHYKGDPNFSISVDGKVIGSTTLGTAEVAEGLTGQTDIYRFFRSDNGFHFFTASEAERDSIIANLPHYQYEGNAFDTTATAATGDEVFRFFRADNGTHFYTISEVERDHIIATLPHYKYEGAAYHAYETNVGGGHEELYRFFRADNGTHFFTASETERDSIMANFPHYKYEGIAYYVDIA